MKKTIKELADELGVSKQTVQYHFKNLPANTYIKNDKGIYILKDQAISILKEKISGKLYGENDKESAKKTDELYSLLYAQLKEKDNQIESLLSGQKHLQKLLDQQQVLTLQANKKIAELELTVNDVEEKMSEQDSTEELKEETNEVKGKSFFSRLFGR